MNKKNIQINIKAEELKKKLNIKDGYTPVKGKDYFDGEKGDTPDTRPIIQEATQKATELVLGEIVSKIPTIEQVTKDLPSFGEKIRDGLELLEGDNRLNISAIDGLDDYDEVSKLAREPRKVVNQYSGGGVRNFINLLDTPSSYSGQTGKYTRVNASEDGLEFAILTPTSPAGSDTQVQFNDGGSFGGDAGLTYNKTTDTLTVGTGAGIVVSHSIKSDASDGLLIEANNGTDIGILGTGNTANVTWYGNHNFDLATQDTIAGFLGSGKTLSSLSTSTYPSLTELSYVKGVTSAIQTQLNAKEVALTFSTGLTRAVNTITANLSTGVSGGQSVIGGTASGDSLTLSSTSDATKGTLIFGTSGNSTYTESTRSLIIGNTGNITYDANDSRIDIIRGGAQVTSGFGNYYPMFVASSTYGGNSSPSIAVIGRTVTGAGANSAILLGHLGDPDECHIDYVYDTDSLKFYLGGNSNPDFTMKGGANIQFGWSYQGTAPSTSKFYLGGAGGGTFQYIDLQSASYAVWAQKIGWDVTANGSSALGKGTYTFSNVVGGTDNVEILRFNEERFGFNVAEKMCSFDFITAADDVSEGTTTANASTTITGTSTIYKKQIAVGDRISLSSASSTYATVTAIASDTSLTVDTALGNGTTQTINIKHGMFRIRNSAGTTKYYMDDTGATFFADNLTTSSYHLRSVGNALTATGSTRTDALQLAKQVNNVTTAAAGTGVILPVGVIGMRITIFNAGANAIQVYASASETIDGTAGSTGVPLTNAKRCEYFYVASNTWISAQMGAVSA